LQSQRAARLCNCTSFVLWLHVVGPPGLASSIPTAWRLEDSDASSESDKQMLMPISSSRQQKRHLKTQLVVWCEIHPTSLICTRPRLPPGTSRVRCPRSQKASATIQNLLTSISLASIRKLTTEVELATSIFRPASHKDPQGHSVPRPTETHEPSTVKTFWPVAPNVRQLRHAAPCESPGCSPAPPAVPPNLTKFQHSPVMAVPIATVQANIATAGLPDKVRARGLLWCAS
jgi:hypothetical protein